MVLKTFNTLNIVGKGTNYKDTQAVLLVLFNLLEDDQLALD